MISCYLSDPIKASLILLNLWHLVENSLLLLDIKLTISKMRVSSDADKKVSIFMHRELIIE
jgi:hypothetical protein